MRKSTFVIFASFFFITSCSHHLPDYTSELSTRNPTENKTEAIGEYSLGCLQGAKTFMGNEKGLFLSQMKRGRYWGHPELIQLLTNAGEHFNKLNKKIILGDLSQSRGGPTLTGHNSHQTGLDVDIWFQMLNALEEPSLLSRETKDMEALTELGQEQVDLIKYFAQDSRVERIFINASFKKKLCTDSKLTFEEHRKLRAWWGHDDHIHVRLKCPKDSPSCVPQKAPEGNGCGEELNWWFGEEAKANDKNVTWEELKKMYLEKIKKLPKECSFYSDL